ncbi:hypothetical protein EG68_10280 [Paragonimus skrjabini miyazakii]|uniref:Protein FMC1 homolog n=1 Tax=Paragonimus skrjabini miyazakii TaxID=59628 RepID=A0A8S9YJ95_9TREM|nr:hypothetical protein EG68_10280 [Paragonimus skrjabini miyazakii]
MSNTISGRHLLLSILREIRLSYNGQLVSSISDRNIQIFQLTKPFTKTPIFRYLLDEFRYNQLTDAQKCARENEAKYLAETYLAYLANTRIQRVLTEKYKSRERTTKEAAQLVGLQLPPDGGSGVPNA